MHDITQSWIIVAREIIQYNRLCNWHDRVIMGVVHLVLTSALPVAGKQEIYIRDHIGG